MPAPDRKAHPDTYYRGIPEGHEAPEDWRQLVAGLAVAAWVMLLAELFLALVFRQPMVFALLAPLTVVLLVVIGVLIAVVTHKYTRTIRHARAALWFGLVAFVVFGVWGGVLFYAAHPLLNPEFEITQVGFATFGALYLGSTFALGGVAGRYLGPALALRWRFVVGGLVAVLVVAVLAAFAVFGTQATGGGLS